MTGETGIMQSLPRKNVYLTIIVLSQFCCTSVWFATNAVLPELATFFSISKDSFAHLTSATQFGFIVGTLCFARLGISDRYKPTRVFLACACIAAAANLAITWNGNGYVSLLVLRTLCGFSLAGIYPVGMKIAADHFGKKLGVGLGLLVGALVLGTAFPHFLNAEVIQLGWKEVIFYTSLVAFTGGLLVGITVPEGPFRKAGNRLKWNVLGRMFFHRPFRVAAFGYFGHMWELYTFWAFTPLIFQWYAHHHSLASINIPLLCASTIACGMLSCFLSGFLGNKFGTQKMARCFLMGSGLCCLISPVLLHHASIFIFYIFMHLWGALVVGDSPLFSTLVANRSEDMLKGSALTLVNSMGYAITILSITLLSFLQVYVSIPFLLILLAVGPIIGVTQLRQK